jgi:hypothetical protein
MPVLGKRDLAASDARGCRQDYEWRKRSIRE